MKKLFLPIILLGLLSCKNDGSDIILMNADNFKTTIDGKSVDLYTLKSESGMVMQVTNFGAHVVSLWTADNKGAFDDVVLGHKSLDEYMNYKGERFIGCVVGRYANRIADGKFVIDSIVYNVPKNNNGQSLHGGLKGLDQVVWNVDTVGSDMIRLSYLSPDGEEGYPGNLAIQMTYSLTADNAFKIEYSATTDKSTFVNLSNHSFFNLKGEGNGTINDHLLAINADSITPIDEVMIPTGELMSVDGTPFDFRHAQLIGQRVNEENEQLKNGSGYDHNWVLNKQMLGAIELAASVYEPQSGRLLEVYTDQPGLQFYGGNFFDGTGNGKYGATYNYREAFALETQKFPDSPNQPNFPSTLLKPGEVYHHVCIYKFSVK